VIAAVVRGVVAPTVVGEAGIVAAPDVTLGAVDVVDAPRSSASSESPHAAITIPTQTPTIATPARCPRLEFNVSPSPAGSAPALPDTSLCLGFGCPVVPTLWSGGDIV
jgi:hypothetical protein